MGQPIPGLSKDNPVYDGFGQVVKRPKKPFFFRRNILKRLEQFKAVAKELLTVDTARWHDLGGFEEIDLDSVEMFLGAIISHIERTIPFVPCPVCRRTRLHQDCICKGRRWINTEQYKEYYAGNQPHVATYRTTLRYGFRPSLKGRRYPKRVPCQLSSVGPQAGEDIQPAEVESGSDDTPAT